MQSLPHFKHEALLPVFEAVVNAIQAIHQAKKSNGIITIKINRDAQLQLELGTGGQETKSHIIGFDIEDNGVGFTDENYESFKTNHSTYKLEFGCKGVGRFVWLKAFDKIEINSTYNFNGSLAARKIFFSLDTGIDSKAINPEKEIKTIVSLCGFKSEYRESSTAYKKGQTIAQRIFEHCLSYYSY